MMPLNLADPGKEEIIKREMNSHKWTWFAIGYQCGFAYLVSLCIMHIGGLFTGEANVVGVIVSVAAIGFMFYMLFRPYKEANIRTAKYKGETKKAA